ncbi:hypothetical protein [Persephonella sp.]
MENEKLVNYNGDYNTKSVKIGNKSVQFQQDNSDKPVLVVRYSKLRKLLYFIIFIIPSLILSTTLAMFYTLQPTEAYIEYLLIKLGGWVWLLVSILFLMDTALTERFEIYRDKIIKRVRILKKLPVVGDKVVYFKDAYIDFTPSGIALCNCKSIIVFIFKRMYFDTLLLDKKDREKVAEVLSDISNIEKEKFLNIGNLDYHKFIQEKSSKN